MSKRIVLFVAASLTLLLVSQGLAADKPRIGVLRFTNDTNAGWWKASVGRFTIGFCTIQIACAKKISTKQTALVGLLCATRATAATLQRAWQLCRIATKTRPTRSR